MKGFNYLFQHPYAYQPFWNSCFSFSKHNLAKSFQVFKMSSSFAEVLSFEVKSEVKSEVKPVELVVPVVLGIPDLEVKTDFKPPIQTKSSLSIFLYIYMHKASYGMCIRHLFICA